MYVCMLVSHSHFKYTYTPTHLLSHVLKLGRSWARKRRRRERQKRRRRICCNTVVSGAAVR
jgi:type VI protein secretion system component VasK